MDYFLVAGSYMYYVEPHDIAGIRLHSLQKGNFVRFELLSYFTLTTTTPLKVIIAPTLQMRKLRLRK